MHLVAAAKAAFEWRSVEGELARWCPPTPTGSSSADGRVDEAGPDDAGVFLLPRPARGPVRLRCRQHGTVLVTEWMPV
jgi:hypothetical protein